MEDSGEVHEEDKVHPENSKKRTLKTPAQVEALEKLYNEHTYPTESIKAQLAQEIGLSEKQVSGWFCHRRLKDKNMLLMKDGAHLMGRQDLSSGVIQDRGSALKQDSCSSTRPGEYKYFDPREVESRRLCGQGSPTRDLTNRNRSQYVHAISNSNMDNTSSGSTSPSQGRMSPPGNHYEMKSSRYPGRNSNYTVMNMNSRGHPVGSEYLNSQDEIEKAAILAVKRQLGRHYREDGPPLGVNFELLPPTAFDAPVEVPVEGPYFLGDPIVPKPVGVLKVHKEPILDTRHSQFKHGMHTHSPYPEADPRQNKLERAYPYDDRTYQSMGKYSLTNSRNYVPGHYTSVPIADAIPSRVTGISNKSKKHVARPMHSVEGKKIGKHFAHPYDEKVTTSGSSHPKLHNIDGDMLKQRGYLKGRPPLILQYDEQLDTEHRDYSRRAKEEHFNKEKRKRKENANVQRNNEAKRRTKQSDEYQQPLDYASRTPSPRALHPRENQIKGYAGEIPTSFSDDETAASSSSMD